MKPPQIAAEDFCKNPVMSSVQLSPSGDKISFLAPSNGHQHLFLQTGPTDKQDVTAETEGDVASYFWKSDRYLIYQAGDELGCTWLYRLDLEKGQSSPILQLTDANSSLIDISLVDLLKWISDDEILVELPRPGQNVSDVYRVNVCSEDLKKRLVAEHPDPEKFGVVRHWIIDNDGEVRGAISLKGTNDYLLTRQHPTGSFKIARVMDFSRSIEDMFYQYLFYTADNKGIYAITRTNRGRNTAAVVILSADTGREIRCLYENPHVDVASFGFSHKRKTVTHVSFHDEKLRHKVLDPETAPIFKTLRQLSRDFVVQVMDHNIDENKFIIFARDDRTPGRYYLLDASNQQKHELTLVGDVAPWLNRKHLARLRPVKFAARDGLPIRGFLTLPVGQKRKRLPLIVNVHGGPENRNYWHYDPTYSGEVQFLANRGYAILQLNFRGSIGYGRSFWKRGFGQRGRKMQDDVTDGVRWIITQGIADPTRIVIYGKSYGGYAALAGVAFTPELYRAAIDCSGVSNWLTWLEDFPPTDPLYPQFCVKVGDPTKDEKRLGAVAPTLHASAITKPVFIVHGTSDQEVDIAESERMVAALQSNHKTVDYMKIPKEGHIFQRQESKLAFYQAMEEFLAKNLASFCFWSGWKAEIHAGK
jgi:dipeptidyl aminopeptidase/acylaminoacyl peptidase